MVHIKDLINLTFCCQQATVITDFSDLEQKGHTDFDRLGREMMEEDGVRQTGFGLVRRLGKPFPPAQETSQQMGGLSC